MAISFSIEAADKPAIDLLLVAPRYPMPFWAVQPLGVLSIAGYLDRHGFSTAVWDFSNDPNATDETLAATLADSRISFVGFSFLSSQLTEVRRLIALVRRHSPATRIVVGGQHVTAVPGETIDADVVVIGEGEVAMRHLLSSRATPGRVVEGAPLQDLAGAPLPDVRILSTYRGFGRTERAAVMASRGCPFACNFCLGRRQRPRRLRWHPTGDVVEWLSAVDEVLGPSDVFFLDDIFTVNRRWVAEICDGIVGRGLDHHSLTCFSHVNVSDEATYCRLAGAGFRQVQIGIESGDDEILRRMGKHFTTRQARATVEVCRATGLEPCGLFLLGYPGETIAAMQRTLEFAESLAIPLWFSVAQPFPGSRFFDEARQTGTLLDADFAHYGNTQIVYLPAGVTLDAMARVVDEASALVARAGRVPAQRAPTSPKE